MAEREKVIRGLEICTNPGTCSESCPYYHIEITEGSCDYFLLTDALALLKEQEPRVMTEVDVLHSIGKPMWFESRGMYLGQKGFWCLLFEVDAELHIRFVQSVTGSKITLALFDYGKLWRFWTSRPTEEQREAAKWNDRT